ncbi:hypothetical protein B0I37DRAFT_155606 [Chaetomium sp. MPI-CAGE-AT-0009]|nr:hypothetical protein B0I37DRAFT_155606 [Chaetomium sp. MPI-CAGE-AT-0009]
MGLILLLLVFSLWDIMASSDLRYRLKRTPGGHLEWENLGFKASIGIGKDHPIKRSIEYTEHISGILSDTA